MAQSIPRHIGIVGSELFPVATCTLVASAGLYDVPSDGTSRTVNGWTNTHPGLSSPRPGSRRGRQDRRESIALEEVA